MEGGKIAIDPEAIADAGVDLAEFVRWSEWLARAEREAVNLDALYRHKRGEALVTLLESDPKLAEWKARSIVEALPQFLQWKEGIAEAQRNVVLLRQILDALRPRIIDM